MTQSSTRAWRGWHGRDGAARRWSASGAAVPWWRRPEEGAPLHRDLGAVSVALPPSLEDTTAHEWADPDRPEHALKAFRRLPPRAGLDAAAAQRRRELRAAFAPFGEASAIVAGHGCFDSRWFRFEVASAEPLVSYVAVLLLGEELVLLEYTAPARCDEVFAAIVDGFTPEWTTRVAPPGFVRRSCDRYRLDMPATLLPPERHSFEGRGLRLVFAQRPLALTRNDVAFELGAGACEELVVTPAMAHELHWDELSARVDGCNVRLRARERSRTCAFRLAHVQRGERFVLSVLAQAGSDPSELELLLRSVLASIREQPPALRLA